MALRFIDISAPLQNVVPADPPGLGPKIEYIDHQQSLPQILPFFPGLRQEDLPDGQGWAVERHRRSGYEDPVKLWAARTGQARASGSACTMRSAKTEAGSLFQVERTVGERTTPTPTR